MGSANTAGDCQLDQLGRSAFKRAPQAYGQAVARNLTHKITTVAPARSRKLPDLTTRHMKLIESPTGRVANYFEDPHVNHAAYRTI
jgi:hypothetical protein